MTSIEKDPVTGTETTGHEWDGIRELNTPLPKWWLYTFYACIAFAAVYAVLYPSVPWITGHTKGLLGYSTRQDVARTIAAATAQQAAFRDRIGAADIETIRKTPELFAFANIGGRAAFNENCAPCHRTGGAGRCGRAQFEVSLRRWHAGAARRDV